METKYFDTETEQQIDRYLRREMDSNQRKHFETRMQAEPELVEEVLLRHDIMVGIQVAERNALRRMMEEPAVTKRATGVAQAQQESRLLSNTWFWVAVSAALVTGAVLALVLGS